MATDWLFAGTHRRAYRTDPTDVAFGVYAFRRRHGAGKPWKSAGYTPCAQPGWLALHPWLPRVYAVQEVRELSGSAGGAVSAFALNNKAEDDTSPLQLLNTCRTPALPCYCTVDASGCFLLVTTFGEGTVHVFALQADGSLGMETDWHRHVGSSAHPNRQAGPHAHAVHLHPGNRFALVPDLGTDRVEVYGFDAQNGKLHHQPARTVRAAPGSGPRHLAFGMGGRFVYLLNEISATLNVYSFDAACGRLHPLQMIDLLPEGFRGFRSGAEVAVHPAGRYLYATTRSRGSSTDPPLRGLDSLVWFHIAPESGLLTLRGTVDSGGEIPRAFAFNAAGNLLHVAHQGSGSIIEFRLHPVTGKPCRTGNTLQTPVPVCLLPVPARPGG